MIVACPSCHSRYSVQYEAIGKGKLVRCALCGTTWQQEPVSDEEHGVRHSIKWILFWLFVFGSIFSLFFAKDFVIKIWPPATELYAIFCEKPNNRSCFAMKNISNFFVMRDSKLYMGLKGELLNTSNDIQYLPSITISLKEDSDAASQKNGSLYAKVWVHTLKYKKLLPNQKITFETELQNIPYNNLICDIKLNT
jgi:predicted Zn finger-like uncharacterized protein